MAHSNKSTEIVPEKDLLADSIYKGKKNIVLKKIKELKKRWGKKFKKTKYEGGGPKMAEE